MFMTIIIIINNDNTFYLMAPFKSPQVTLQRIRQNKTTNSIKTRHQTKRKPKTSVLHGVKVSMTVWTGVFSVWIWMLWWSLTVLCVGGGSSIVWVPSSWRLGLPWCWGVMWGWLIDQQRLSGGCGRGCSPGGGRRGKKGLDGGGLCMWGGGFCSGCSTGPGPSEVVE